MRRKPVFYFSVASYNAECTLVGGAGVGGMDLWIDEVHVGMNRWVNE
jgi:hypothetical protein